MSALGTSLVLSDGRPHPLNKCLRCMPGTWGLPASPQSGHAALLPPECPMIDPMAGAAWLGHTHHVPTRQAHTECHRHAPGFVFTTPKHGQNNDFHFMGDELVPGDEVSD